MYGGAGTGTPLPSVCLGLSPVDGPALGSYASQSSTDGDGAYTFPRLDPDFHYKLKATPARCPAGWASGTTERRRRPPRRRSPCRRAASTSTWPRRRPRRPTTSPADDPCRVTAVIRPGLRRGRRRHAPGGAAATACRSPAPRPRPSPFPSSSPRAGPRPRRAPRGFRRLRPGPFLATALRSRPARAGARRRRARPRSPHQDRRRHRQAARAGPDADDRPGEAQGRTRFVVVRPPAKARRALAHERRVTFTVAVTAAGTHSGRPDAEAPRHRQDDIGHGRRRSHDS